MTATAASARNLQSLQKRLELTAAFSAGDERFSVSVTDKSDESWWNYKRRAIQLGVEGVEEGDLDEIAELLMEHEVGHVLNTTPGLNSDVLPFPFSLLNILEDARIEPMRKRNFFPLHSHSYKRHYLSTREEQTENFADPFNIGVLRRWVRWGVETETARPPELTQPQYEEFVEDWDYFIDRSIEGDSTETVCGHAQDLYEKWKFLFDKYDAGKAALGSIEQSASATAGEGEPAQETKRATGSSSTDITHVEQHFGEAWFTWDMAYIAEHVRVIRQLLKPQEQTEVDFSLSGRRFDPRRIEHPPLAPFRVEVPSHAAMKLARILLVLDGSGSMMGDPFYNGATLAYVLSEVFQADLLITTTTNSEEPIEVRRENIDLLRRFTAWGDGENYRSCGNRPQAYPFSLFLTDANVATEDQEYIRHMSKSARIGAGYVGNQGQSLQDVFDRNFVSESLDQSIGRMVALFLRRFFMRYVTQ